MIYLDNAATTLKKPACVVEAVVAAMTSMGNAARGAHGSALSASRVVYDARCKIAELFGCKNADHVIFTCNSTEALNIAISGTKLDGDAIVTSGGRVLGITAVAPTLEAALADAYAAADTITFEKKYQRNDIGRRALSMMEV